MFVKLWQFLGFEGDTIAYTVQFRLQPFKRSIGPLIDAVVVLIHVKAEAGTEPKPQTLNPKHLRHGAPKYTSLNSAAGAGCSGTCGTP